MVVFDCEKMKFPDTGLFYFCDNLGKALKKEISANGDTELAFYLRKNLVGRFGNGCKYIEYKPFHKYFLPFGGKGDSVWHTAFQFPKSMPSKGNVVLTIHDLNFLYEADEKVKEKCIKKINRYVRRASRITAISEYTKKDILEHLDVGGKTVDVIYNGCNKYEGPVSAPEDKPEKPFLFAIGALLPKKNFHVLPCLLQDNDYELIIAGLKYPYESRITEEARLCGVQDRVHILGPIADSLKHWYLRNCEAFLFPSLAEGFGLPVLEAMSYGKPVFLSRHTSLPEIGGDKAFYFNYAFDREKMKEEFSSGMRDFAAGKLSPEEVIAHAESFSWDNAAKKYIEIYKSLMH